MSAFFSRLLPRDASDTMAGRHTVVGVRCEQSDSVRLDDALRYALKEMFWVRPEDATAKERTFADEQRAKLLIVYLEAARQAGLVDPGPDPLIPVGALRHLLRAHAPDDTIRAMAHNCFTIDAFVAMVPASWNKRVDEELVQLRTMKRKLQALRVIEDDDAPPKKKAKRVEGE